MAGLHFLLVIGACSCTALVVRRSAPAVRSTSLIVARRWLILAMCLVSLMAASDLLLRQWPGKTADYGWLLCAIVLLCPPLSVLGARRPGVQVWTWFILVPMVLVLSWPIWTQLLQGADWRGLALETPTVLGFLLVLVMGAGNYLGTRFAISTVLFALGEGGIMITCLGGTFPSEGQTAWIRAISLLVLECAVLSAFLRRKSAANQPHPVNRLWNDFRNTFGLVWALRLVERINAYALQEHWTIRMTWDGFPENAEGQLAADEAQVQAACRWMFRRFVDDDWITARLGPLNEPQMNQPQN